MVSKVRLKQLCIQLRAGGTRELSHAFHVQPFHVHLRVFSVWWAVSGPPATSYRVILAQLPQSWFQVTFMYVTLELPSTLHQVGLELGPIECFQGTERPRAQYL